VIRLTPSYTRRAGETGFDASKYAEKWGEAPIYHQGNAQNGGLAAKLQEIKNLFPEPNLSTQRKIEMLDEIKKLYESEPYTKLKMWPAARDWLKVYIDPGLLP
jgi:hypothetical protein